MVLSRANGHCTTEQKCKSPVPLGKKPEASSSAFNARLQSLNIAPVAAKASSRKKKKTASLFLPP